MKQALGYLAILCVASVSTAAGAQSDFDKVEITAQEIRPGVAVLFGEGGNIGVSYGTDGTAIIDDQFAPLSEKIRAAIAKLGAKPVKYVVNTHWHFDHAGGNVEFGQAGATILAHDAVRMRLAKGGKVAGRDIPPDSREALPVVTYDQGIKLHLNGDTIDIRFFGGGHTDGDSVVYWRKANVLHTGDLFMHRLGYPFIDTASGGSIDHFLISLGQVLAMIDDETVIIPGHGKLATRAALLAFRNMIATATERIRAMKDSGATLEEAKARNPIAGLRTTQGFIGDQQFIESVWSSLDAHGH